MHDSKLAELLTLQNFNKFVSEKDPNDSYDYLDQGVSMNTKGCALVQFMRHHGYKDAVVTTQWVFPHYDRTKTIHDNIQGGNIVILPCELDSVSKVTGVIDDSGLNFKSSFGELNNKIKKRLKVLEAVLEPEQKVLELV